MLPKQLKRTVLRIRYRGLRLKLPPRLVNWWTFRDVRADDVSIGAGGETGYLLCHTRRRFKGCVCVEVDRAYLRELADRLRDFVDDEDGVPR